MFIGLIYLGILCAYGYSQSYLLKHNGVITNIFFTHILISVVITCLQWVPSVIVRKVLCKKKLVNAIQISFDIVDSIFKISQLFIFCWIVWNNKLFSCHHQRRITKTIDIFYFTDILTQINQLLALASKGSPSFQMKNWTLLFLYCSTSYHHHMT